MIHLHNTAIRLNRGRDEELQVPALFSPLAADGSTIHCHNNLSPMHTDAYRHTQGRIVWTHSHCVMWFREQFSGLWWHLAGRTWQDNDEHEPCTVQKCKERKKRKKKRESVYRQTEGAVNYCERESENASHISPKVVLTIGTDLHEGYDGRTWIAHQVIMPWKVCVCMCVSCWRWC